MNLFEFTGVLPETNLSDLWGPQPLSERLNPTPLFEDQLQGAHLRHRLMNREITCRICRENGHWLPEGLAWVCEHEPIDGVPVRHFDSVRRDEGYAYDPATGELLKVEELE